jgi:CheY-like chemotaxis protein
LVVDDDVEFCTILSEVLRGFGFDVQVAFTVERALDHLRQMTPDLIITDVRMPEADGIILIHHLRDEARLNCIPTIIVSALPRSEVIALTERHEADAFLDKPFSIRKLRSTVSTFMPQLPLPVQ